MLLCSLRLSLGYKPYTSRVENIYWVLDRRIYSLSSFCFLCETLFGILSVHVLCDSAMTSLEGREGEMRHKGLMAPWELDSLLRQRCVAWASKASQAQHKACVVAPEFGIQDVALFPERQAVTMRKALQQKLYVLQPGQPA